MAGDDMFAPLICDEDLEFGARQLFRRFLILLCTFLVIYKPWVTIRWFEGRSYETKKKVMKLVTNAVVKGCGCKSEDVSIVFEDMDKRDWGKAGIPYSEK